MSPETEFFSAIFCFGFAIVFFVLQTLRLMFPVWAWKFEKNGREAMAALKASATYTAKSLTAANPSQACFARLVKAEDLTVDEKMFKRNLQFKLFLAAAAGVLVYWVRFAPELPDQADSYATDVLLIALGLAFQALANYRIYRTIRTVMGENNLPLPDVSKKKKDQNAAQ